MSDQITYIPYTRDDLVRSVGFVAANLASKLDAFADEKGVIYVSFGALAELWNVDVRVIRKAADTLSALQIWHYTRGNGRGHLTVWEKGANYATFVTLKRVQIMQKKGTKNAPYNKDNNKDRLISAHTREINQSGKGFDVGDTPTPPIIMEEFEQFYQAFFFGKYAKHEKEQAPYKDRAAAVWRYLPEEKRAGLLRDIKAGKRYDKTHWILWYVKHYEPLPPIWFNEDLSLTAEMIDGLAKFRYKNKCAYCMPGDLQTWLNNGGQKYEEL